MLLLLTLREKCRNTEFFLVHIFLYSVRIQKIRTRKNTVFGHFSQSAELEKPLKGEKSELRISNINAGHGIKLLLNLKK